MYTFLYCFTNYRSFSSDQYNYTSNNRLVEISHCRGADLSPEVQNNITIIHVGNINGALRGVPFRERMRAADVSYMYTLLYISGTIGGEEKERRKGGVEGAREGGREGERWRGRRKGARGEEEGEGEGGMGRRREREMGNASAHKADQYLQRVSV